jgi:hypothetical protein
MEISRTDRWARRTGWRLALCAIVVGLGLLTPRTGVIPGAAPSVQAQGKRLENMVHSGGRHYHRFSDDGGNTWSQWFLIPNFNGWVQTLRYQFVGPVSVVSPAPGYLQLAAKTTSNQIIGMRYSSYRHAWEGWFVFDNDAAGGGVSINGAWYGWHAGSYPVLAARADGNLDLFINATRDDGAIALVHTWTDRWDADGEEWSENWEVLGTGSMQGSPAAVSWGPGRTDVFVRGGGNELAHKWYANGRWSRGWENLGGTISSSPSATSAGPGHISVIASGMDQQLWEIWYNGVDWIGWEPRWNVIGVGTHPSVVSAGWGNLDIAFLGPDRVSLFQQKYSAGPWTTRSMNSTFGTDPTSVYWIP